jgi:hypothetical protein
MLSRKVIVALVDAARHRLTSIDAAAAAATASTASTAATATSTAATASAAARRTITSCSKCTPARPWPTSSAPIASWRPSIIRTRRPTARKKPASANFKSWARRTRWVAWSLMCSTPVQQTCVYIYICVCVRAQVLTDETKRQLYDQGNDYEDIVKHMQQQNNQQANPFGNAGFNVSVCPRCAGRRLSLARSTASFVGVDGAKRAH